MNMVWKKGDEKDNVDEKDVEEKVKSEEEEVQEMEESKNGDEKVDGDKKVEDVAEEEDSEQPTAVMYYTGKKDVQHENEASADQITTVSVEEQTLEVKKTKDEASQASAGQTTVVFIKKQTIVVVQTEVVIYHQEKDVGETSQLVLMESKVDVTLKKRHTLTEEEINEIAVKIVCEMNRLHAHLDELLPGVLLESFIQRPISQDEKNQVDQVWPLRKDRLTPEAKKDNSSTFMRIREETVCLNALYTLYQNQWLDNEVIDVYSKALIQYFDTQHRACLDNERIMLVDIFACQYIGRAFNV
ncbi:hypothetical protein GIB67_014790 [Kingdonia uniflora]|uniref:Uncharacterized protein n=1 Tax=Kingdonia uniflora TaxID=39325 RepID=A0A7J7NV48_9MAGN|nr:hypothetical protein GIB67_014790 [Kingdonia uniflora]